jgi:GH15 family glucan-1,4-alpha-glucosidase
MEVGREIIKDFPECTHLVYEIDILQPKILESIQRVFIKDDLYIRSKNNHDTDISLLGTAVPFKVAMFNDKFFESTVHKIEEDLKLPNGGYLRYINDKYMGGNAWIISSLWLALYYIEVNQIDRARELYDWVTAHQDSKGFLAEQIDRDSGKPAWIVGLSWSHALYIIVGKKLH